MAKLYVKVKTMTIYAGKKETQMYSDVVLMAVGVIEQGIGRKKPTKPLSNIFGHLVRLCKISHALEELFSGYVRKDM